jgi:monoamine oxidase
MPRDFFEIAVLEVDTAHKRLAMAPETYDVVVVGAGLAGLQAARTLQSSGLKCIVLEARDRIGGRTYSVRSESGLIKSELGAAWINDTNQSRMWALAQELGLRTIVQNTKGDVVVQDFDGTLVKFPYGDVPKVTWLISLHH